MKCTIFITQQCNLACKYCYIRKHPVTISPEVAEKVVDFGFRHAPPGEQIDFGYFGGEPLLEFETVKAVTRMIEQHPTFSSRNVTLSLVTNGTIFSDEIADFVRRHNIGFGVSCDGPASTHDLFRRFPDGGGTSDTVAKTIREAVAALDAVIVNAVYHPRTLRRLPETVGFLSSLGVRQIYLNADYSAPWRRADAEHLLEVFDEIGRQYIDFYMAEQPCFISLIDSKIAVMLRGGYAPDERCRMGKAEFAFTPDGGVYPCERLVGAGDGEHRIGHVDDDVLSVCQACHLAAGSPINTECLTCGLRGYCMNWCGCSNYLGAGYYNRVSPFLCASEKAAIQTALHVYQTLEASLGPAFVEHASGFPLLNSVRYHEGESP